MVIVKKYGNRRLYDTEASRYVTLEELAEKVRGGTDVRVVDAKTGEDLTQVTLMQIIVESRRAAHLISAPLLTQLVRMGDDALAEFFGRYVTWALEVYLTTKQSARALGPLNPFPLFGQNPLLRMFSGVSPWGEPPQAQQLPPPREPQFVDTPPPPPPPQNEMAELRRQVEELRSSLRVAPAKKPVRKRSRR